MAETRSSTNIKILVAVLITAAVSFTCGLVVGLPVLGWWLWPLQRAGVSQAAPTEMVIALPALAGDEAASTPESALPGGRTESAPTQAAPTQAAPTTAPLPASSTPAAAQAAVPTSTPAPLPAAGPQAVVKAAGVKLMDGPGKGYGVVAKLDKAAVLQVSGKAENCRWLKVAAPTGQQGWILYNKKAVSLDGACEGIPEGTYRPMTGVLKAPAGSGAGQLKIDNGSAADGVVVITRAGSPGKTAAAVYLRSGEQFRLEGIPDGAYRVYFLTGAEWDGAQKRFTQGLSANRFADPIQFTTTDQKYTIWEITLHPVAGGTAQTETIPPDEFPPIE